jgi:uncharacterized SAM-binding protein YcdF (DUF218 family)
MSGGRSLGRDLTAVLTIAAVGFAAAAAFAAFEIVRQGSRDEARPADAIVVLGAAQYNGVPSAVFAARLDHAVKLYKEGIARVFVVTGGKLPGDNFTEAQTARTYAIDHGVPASAIVGEDTGRDTLESLENVGALLRAKGLTSVVFVSDRTHMLRVLRMATDQGLRSYGSPTPDSPTDLDPWRRAQAVGHELAGLLAYLLGGGQWISDPALLGQ